VNLVIGAVGFAVLLSAVIATEFVAPVERHTARSRLTGIGFTVVSVVCGLLTLTALQALWRAAGIPHLVSVPFPGLVGDVAAVGFGVLVYDFLAYWHHRAQHRFFWRIHQLHHSQTELHAANGYAHFLESATQFLLIAIPLSLIDFNVPQTPLALIAIRQVLEFYIHSPVGAHFGPLRGVLVDNRFHRIHHSLEPQHFDRNFGIMLSIWDRLFGTAIDPHPDEWPAVGVAGLPPPKSLVDYLLMPLRPVRADRRAHFVRT
jgi:sterol desaturase/sphingolipid hydroxylase (fatty acid hydroxylase superfamily)